MEKEYNLFMSSVAKYDPSKAGSLEGPYFSTKFWEEDFNGTHPVDMLAKIATFQSKPTATFEPYRKPIREKQKDQSYNKVICCTYDVFESFGNGKMEKQAKLVAARNMIVKLKKVNIGIVNETLAAGVKVDVNPHKKPITAQFKMFQKAGQLGSFVAASSSGVKTGAESARIVDIQAKQEKEKQEYETFKDFVDNDETKATSKPATSPKIVFKRANSDATEEPATKVLRNDSDFDNRNEHTGSQSFHHNVGPPNFFRGGYQGGQRGSNRGHWHGFGNFH